MYCCHAHVGLGFAQRLELKSFVLSWSEKWFGPANVSVSPVAPVTPLSNDPVAEDSDPDTCAE